MTMVYALKGRVDGLDDVDAFARELERDRRASVSRTIGSISRQEATSRSPLSSGTCANWRYSSGRRSAIWLLAAVSRRARR